MSTYKLFRNALVTTSFGALLLLGSVTFASAQNMGREYQQWQRAQMEAQQRYQDYLRTRSGRDYQQWQRAQARAQREYSDYQQAMNRSNRYRDNDGDRDDRRYNNGYYNGSYNNGYYNNAGRYRVYTNGSYYEVDSRGAELLRQAIRNGYSQGYRQGQIDRSYRRGYNYGVNSVYNNGLYGWQSYVARDQYQYYFQEGFQRGYEDGYNNTLRYGMRSGNGFNIVSGVLNTILNLADIH